MGCLLLRQTCTDKFAATMYRAMNLLVTMYQLVTRHQLVTMYEPMYELAMAQPQQHSSSQATACQMTGSLLPIASFFSIKVRNSNSIVSILFVTYRKSIFILYLFAKSIVVKDICKPPSAPFKNLFGAAK